MFYENEYIIEGHGVGMDYLRIPIQVPLAESASNSLTNRAIFQLFVELLHASIRVF
jgi:hypothetical protein